MKTGAAVPGSAERRHRPTPGARRRLPGARADHEHARSGPAIPRRSVLNPKIDPTEQAEVVANQERNRLGLGDQPVIYLRSTLEWDVGLRIFYTKDLPSNIAGMYAYSADLGACILINRNHPPERRRVSMLHEYGHFLLSTDRYKPGIDYLTMPGRKPANERFAEAFALSFLMPATSVRQKIPRHRGDDGRLSGGRPLPHEALLLRVAGSDDSAGRAVGTDPERDVGEPEGVEDSPRARPRRCWACRRTRSTTTIVPERYKYLAVHAYERGDLGDSDLAHYLRCDIATAREIVPPNPDQPGGRAVGRGARRSGWTSPRPCWVRLGESKRRTSSATTSRHRRLLPDRPPRLGTGRGDPPGHRPRLAPARRRAGRGPVRPAARPGQAGIVPATCPRISHRYRDFGAAHAVPARRPAGAGPVRPLRHAVPLGRRGDVPGPGRVPWLDRWRPTTARRSRSRKQAGLTVVSCPELVKAWADATEPDHDVLRPGPDRHPDARPVPAEPADCRCGLVDSTTRANAVNGLRPRGPGRCKAAVNPQVTRGKPR